MPHHNSTSMSTWAGSRLPGIPGDRLAQPEVGHTQGAFAAQFEAQHGQTARFPVIPGAGMTAGCGWYRPRYTHGQVARLPGIPGTLLAAARGWLSWLSLDVHLGRLPTAWPQLEVGPLQLSLEAHMSRWPVSGAFRDPGWPPLSWALLLSAPAGGRRRLRRSKQASKQARRAGGQVWQRLPLALCCSVALGAASGRLSMEAPPAAEAGAAARPAA